MGLFDKIFKAVPEEDKLSKQESFAGIAQSEWDGICAYLRRLRLYDNFSGPAFDKMFDKLFRILKNQGASALVACSVEGLPEDMKLTAFACAVDIALADGVVEDEEKEIINQLAESLQIPEATAVSIIEVLIIKNKA